MRDIEAVGDVWNESDEKPNSTYEEKDFRPDDWKRLMNQARTEKLLRSKTTKIRTMAESFLAKYREEERYEQEKRLAPFKFIRADDAVI